MRGIRIRGALPAAGESLLAVALATGAVALLEHAAPATGLSVVYLLAVMTIAVRRGEAAAIGTAVLSVLCFNWFFIEPRHELNIRAGRDAAVLSVFLLVALVVARLAASARARAAEASARAGEARAREREAALLATAAEAVLAGEGGSTQLDALARRIARPLGASRVRVVLTAVPSPAEDELSLALGTKSRTSWLVVSRDSDWTREELARLAAPLGRLLDVALERERLAERTAEAEGARRAEVAKTAILHAISHDLRTPLTAIRTAAEGLRAGELEAADRTELAAVVDTESSRLARLVDDLLDLSKIQAGAADPRRDWCDLRDVAARAAEQVRARHGGHPIVLELPATLPLVRADAAQLERVLVNLLDNAVHASAPGARVRLKGTTGAKQVTLRVIDSGPGIPAPQRTRIFEPFVRAREGNSGSGLGLAIARGFVEANGGRISLGSGVDGGASFAVSFPVEPQPVGLP